MFLLTTNLHITSFTSLSWVCLHIAFHSKRLHAVPYLRQEVWQCLSLQLTFTSPPSQVCLEFTFALLFTANAFTLRHIFVKRYGNVSLYNLPSQHLHHKFDLSLPSHCFSQQAPSHCAFFNVNRYGSFSLSNLSSHRLHDKFFLALPSHCFLQQTPSRCALLLSREVAVFISTTYLHITSITSLSWVCLRIAFHSKRLHAAPYFCQEIWQCFSPQLTFTSPPSHACLLFIFALLNTESVFTIRLLYVKRYGSVSLYNFPSHPLHCCRI